MSLTVYSDIVARGIKKFGDKTALEIKRDGVYESWSYNRFHSDINALVSAMHFIGTTENSNGIVIGANSPEWIISYHAIFMAGSCTIPIDPNLPSDEIEEILKVTEAEIIFCSSEYLTVFKKLSKIYSSIKQIVVLDSKLDFADAKCITYQQFLTKGDSNKNAFSRKFSEDDSLAILFTSGTTGKSKGVELLQKNFAVPSKYGTPLMQLTTDDSIITVLPLYHVFGFAACISACFNNGITAICIPEIKGSLIVEAMNDKQASVLAAVPQMLVLFNNKIMRGVAEKRLVVKIVFKILFLLSSTVGAILGINFRRKLFASVHKSFGGNFSKIVSGGASLDKKTFNSFKLMGFDIVEGYGLTETFGPITLCPISKQTQGSVGPVLAKNSIKIDSPDKNGNGEIWLKGDSIFKGYYKNRAETKKVFTDDGWFKTGDLGYLDKSNFLFLNGRIKDVIVLDSGKNIYPDELEEYYQKSNLIEEMGVFALEIDNQTKCVGIIVPNSNLLRKNSLDKTIKVISREIFNLNRNRPDYKKISDYAISTIPLQRTSTKKIKKNLLPKLFKELKLSKKGTLIDIKISAVEESIMADNGYLKLTDLISELIISYDKIKITPSLKISDDLNFDSLRFVDLISNIEQTLSITIPEKELCKIVTVLDLYKIINTSSHTILTDNSIRNRIKNNLDLNLELNDYSNFLVYLLMNIAQLSCKFLWGLKISGSENIPTNTPIMISPNHQSLLDSPLIYYSLPKDIRKKTYALGKIELTKVPFMNYLIRHANVIPVERDGDIITPLKASFKLISEKRNIIIFPEGTRSFTQELLPFRSGIGMLMKETGATVIPIRVINTGVKWRKGKLPAIFSGWKNRPKLIIGKPITYDSLIEKGLINSKSDDMTITNVIRDIIISI